MPWLYCDMSRHKPGAFVQTVPSLTTELFYSVCSSVTVFSSTQAEYAIPTFTVFKFPCYDFIYQNAVNERGMQPVAGII